MKQNRIALVYPSNNLKLVSFWIAWIAMSIAGAAVGWAVIALGSVFTAGISLVLAGLPVGFTMGWVQSRLLRDWLQYSHPSLWLQRTLIGTTLAWLTVVILYLAVAILDGLVLDNIIGSNQLIALPILGIGGLVFAIIQKEALGGLLSGNWWYASNVVGWIISGYLGFVGTNLILAYPSGSLLVSLPHALYFMVAGTLCTSLISIIIATDLAFRIHKGAG
ncbi:MAG: hypothetical protein ABI670_08205 [Chloroflexota bacterium]